MNFRRGASVLICTIIQCTQIVIRANLSFLVARCPLSPFRSFFSLSECFVEDVSVLETLIERFNTLHGKDKDRCSNKLYNVVLK